MEVKTQIPKPPPRAPEPSVQPVPRAAGSGAGPGWERSASSWLRCHGPVRPGMNRDRSHAGHGRGGEGARAGSPGAVLGAGFPGGLWGGGGHAPTRTRQCPAVLGRRGARPGPARTIRAAAPAGGGSGRRSWAGWRGPARPGGWRRAGLRDAAAAPGPGGAPAGAAASAGIRAGRGASWARSAGHAGGCSPGMRGRAALSAERRPGRRWALLPPPRYAALAPRSPRGAGGERGAMAAPEPEGAGLGAAALRLQLARASLASALAPAVASGGPAPRKAGMADPRELPRPPPLLPRPVPVSVSQWKARNLTPCQINTSVC